MYILFYIIIISYRIPFVFFWKLRQEFGFILAEKGRFPSPKPGVKAPRFRVKIHGQPCLRELLPRF